MSGTIQRLVVPLHGQLNINPAIEQLSRELAIALGDWKAGGYRAVVHPANDPRGVRVQSLGNDLDARLREAAQDYRLIAEKIDPTARIWHELRDVDPSLPQRFMLIGERYL